MRTRTLSTLATAAQLVEQNPTIMQAQHLRTEGRHAEADALMAAYAQEVAREAENVSRRTHMTARRDNLHAVVHVNPEDDGELFAKCRPDDPAGYLRVAVSAAEQDNGPAEKGMAGPQYLYFLRNIEKLPPIEAAKKFEAKVDARLNRIHHFLARAGNRWTWDVVVEKHGLDGARERAASVKWIKVRRHDHLDEIAENIPSAADSQGMSETETNDLSVCVDDTEALA